MQYVTCNKIIRSGKNLVRCQGEDEAADRRGVDITSGNGQACISLHCRVQLMNELDDGWLSESHQCCLYNHHSLGLHDWRRWWFCILYSNKRWLSYFALVLFQVWCIYSFHLLINLYRETFLCLHFEPCSPFFCLNPSILIFVPHIVCNNYRCHYNMVFFWGRDTRSLG